MESCRIGFYWKSFIDHEDMGFTSQKTFIRYLTSYIFKSMEIQIRIAFDQINLACHSKSFRGSEQEDPGPESDPFDLDIT